MKKKRYCAAALLLTAGLLLTGCGGDAGNSGTDAEVDDQALSSLKSIQENVRAIKDAEIAITTESSLKRKGAENPIVINTQSSVKEVFQQEGIPNMELTYSQNTDGKEEKTIIYVKDGKTYVHEGKEKISLDVAGIYGNYINLAALAQNLILNVDEQRLKGLTRKEEKDQSIYQITLDKEQLGEYLQKAQGLTQGEKERTDEEPTAAAADVEKLELQVTADKENHVRSVELSCVSHINQDSEAESSMEEAYTLKAQFISLNTGMKIDFPDFSKYKKAD